MKRLINQCPGPVSTAALALLPFVVLVLVYLLASDARLAENPNDKLLPSFTTLAESFVRLTSVPSQRTGEILLWQDTGASLRRLAQGVGISAAIGLVLGIVLGAIPLIRSGFAPFVAVLSLIPPMAVLPVLFIVFGLGEVSKVVLIVVGITPFIVRDLQQRVQELPRELIIKAQTLGANSWQIILRVILPQILPRLIDAVRLSLGTAWLFLISAEAIAATEGLGYRIFLVRRYLAMDVILPYVVWITILAYLTDFLLKQISRRVFPWYHTGGPGR
ncbi:ABC transporter permease [Thiocapsa bogorovii]|uniref:ABC transporter permease n=1 Tax=Thiocapsa bogorovii TaxID=521689 RepID=UPI001E5FDA43|nr:ABC transporter permease [Thiocapsa bogorovii]UHD15289.1 ABC transporter permease [Thiocapsa bogorovii]